MKKHYSLIISSLTVSLLAACGSNNIGSTGANNSGPNSGPQAIIPPSTSVVLQPHTTSSAYYNSKTNNPYYQAYLVTNKSSKATTINAISITGTNATEFAIESNASSYAGAPQCSSGMSLAGNSSCAVVVSLTNPSVISESKKTALLSVTAAGIQSNSNLSKTSYAYVAGSFSQAYANASKNVPAVTASGSGSCGTGGNACQLLQYNLANHSLTSIASTDQMVTSMSVGESGTIYFGGLLTQASAGGTTLSQPGVGSLVVLLNPAISNGITDVISASGLSGTSNYPDQPIYTMAYNKHQLYIAGGFSQMAGIVSGSGGFPVITYNTTQTGQSAWNNVFTAGDPDLAVSTIGFDANNNMYISGVYSNIDGLNFNPSGLYGYFPVNQCKSTDGGVTFSCASTDYVVTDSTGNLEGIMQPAASILFDPTGMMYISGGFSQIGNVGTAASANYMIATSSNVDPIDSATWASSFLGNNYPNNVIGTTAPFAANNFLVGGYFSSIGGISADANLGTCGAGALSYSGTQSCLFAQFDGTNFSKNFTTDGWISSVVYVNQIGS